MKISVVIPAYNEENYIESCMHHLQMQTVTPYEIIVVDNNSTDKTAEMARKFGAKVIEEKQQGISYARDAGFNAATGDVFLRTDADTWVPKDWVERMQIHFEDHRVMRVSGGAVFYKAWLDPLFRFFVFWVNDPFGYKAMFGPNLAIRREAWEKIKDKVCHDDVALHEDLDMAIHLGKNGKYIRDCSLKVTTSHRRVSRPKSLFWEYHLKWRHTVFMKKHLKLSEFALFRFL